MVILYESSACLVYFILMCCFYLTNLSFQIKHGVDAFLVLISDGVSYSINDQECIDFISQFSNPLEAAQLLTDQALHFGSEDNSTAVVVPFGAWGKYSTSPTFSLGRNILS